jgi:hypothetical protein
MAQRNEDGRCYECDGRNCLCPSQEFVDDQVGLGEVIGELLAQPEHECPTDDWCLSCQEMFRAHGFEVAPVAPALIDLSGLAVAS